MGQSIPQLHQLARNRSDAVYPNLRDGLALACYPACGAQGSKPLNLLGTAKLGTIGGATTWGTSLLGTALSFTGSATAANFIQVTNAPTGARFSIVANLIATSLTGYRSIYVDQSSGLYLNAGKLDWYVGGDHLGTATLSLNVPYQVALTSDGSNIYGYINGIRDFTAVLAATLPTSATTLGIAGHNATIENFAGFVSSLIVNSARPYSPVEIAQLYTDPFAPFRRREGARVYTGTYDGVRTPAAATTTPQTSMGLGIGLGF